MTFVLLKTMIPRVINNIPKLVEIGEFIPKSYVQKLKTDSYSAVARILSYVSTKIPVHRYVFSYKS
ncbi:hypothetical protein NQ317_003647 [Molorchus minor]|uniref:Uncharacterized protein n=1 Tax=Molorchus minor TaxID=1323400 RepID=A0ABQ9JHI4_9CUCU|nr:hypothetical protein NQ317_003647 [Molorchus minor]